MIHRKFKYQVGDEVIVNNDGWMYNGSHGVIVSRDVGKNGKKIYFVSFDRCRRRFLHEHGLIDMEIYFLEKMLDKF